MQVVNKQYSRHLENKKNNYKSYDLDLDFGSPNNKTTIQNVKQTPRKIQSHPYSYQLKDKKILARNQNISLNDGLQFETEVYMRQMRNYQDKEQKFTTKFTDRISKLLDINKIVAKKQMESGTIQEMYKNLIELKVLDEELKKSYLQSNDPKQIIFPFLVNNKVQVNDSQQQVQIEPESTRKQNYKKPFGFNRHRAQSKM